MKKLLLAFAFLFAIVPALASAQTGGVVSDLKANFSDGPLSVVSGSTIDLSWSTKDSNYCKLSIQENGGQFRNVVVLNSREDTPTASGIYQVVAPTDSLFPFVSYLLNCQTSTNIYSSDSVTVKIFTETERQEIIQQLKIKIVLLIEELRKLMLAQQSSS